ncbi:transmembrane protein 234 homolog [Leptinotarsa decemlineata]|uniref:transmembrane protein 234 homolog n=1 Tax=Leptinotarsa decemlineata TaxID=7539 RepID=UPI003D308E4D
MISQILKLIVVGLLWGATNPVIKRKSKDIQKVKADSKLIQFILELKYLATNIQYLIPMAFNQLGSVLYFITLQEADLTLSVPLANSLTFVFTAVSGWIMGEEIPKKSTIFGVFLVILGTLLCCVDKYERGELKS